MIKGLLVDLDGTLANSIEPLKQAFFGFLRAHGVESSDEEFVSFTGASLHEIIRDLKRKHGLKPMDDELYAQYVDVVFQAYTKTIKPMPGAVETLLLAKQKKLKMALVTAASEEMAVLFLKVNDLSDLFDALICARMGEPGKPHPALYLRGLEVLGLQAAEAIAIEDSLNGVKSALAADCETLWLTPYDVPLFDEHVYQVRDWLEIRKWLEAI